MTAWLLVTSKRLRHVLHGWSLPNKLNVGGALPDVRGKPRWAIQRERLLVVCFSEYNHVMKVIDKLLLFMLT
jgi:hypothetical protein